MPEVNTNENKPLSQVIQDSFKELKETAIAFVNAPKALWGINLPYVIEGLVYFGILTILGKFCSENIGLTDPQAGWIYSAVTGGITFSMLILGGVTDKIGVRMSLILAFLIMMAGRIVVAFSGTVALGQGITSPMFFVMIGGLLLMVTGYGLYQPAAYAGVKRYTNPKTAAMGYAVIYGLMNLGAFFSGFISPITRHNFETVFPPNGLTAVFWIYAILTFIALVATVILLTRKTDQAAVEKVVRETAAENKETKKEVDKTTAKEKFNNWPFVGLVVLSIALLVFIIYANINNLALPMALIYGLLSISAVITVWEFLRHRPDHPFRDVRFVFFIFILIPVQTLFAHVWLTLPYYLDRAFHGSMVSEYFELFSNINPILIFILAPVVAGLTAKANVYRMMILGTFVMALPVFLLTAGPNLYLFLTYILIMSIGEAMWQPRFLQWIAEIAPEGKTGLYMGIGQFPWFLTKVVTGLYSGFFIKHYIPKPETGLEQNTGEMWFIYGLIAMISPISLVLAKKWMSKKMEKKA